MRHLRGKTRDHQTRGRFSLSHCGENFVFYVGYIVGVVYYVVTQRVSNSRVRVRHGFQLPGPGSGPVFVNFQNRVRVLPCRVSGFCRVSNLCQKVTFLKEKQSWKKFF